MQDQLFGPDSQEAAAAQLAPEDNHDAHMRWGTPCRVCNGRRADEAAQLGGHQATQHADAEWTARALDRLDGLVAMHLPFTADDVVAAVGLPSEGSSNAVGGLVQAYAKRKAIKRIGYTKSTRRESHARVIAIWVGVAA